MDGSTLAMINSRPPSHPQHRQQAEYYPHHHHDIDDDRFEVQNPHSPSSGSRVGHLDTSQAPAYKPSPMYEQPLQKVVVDWPTERDEEEYRFVSSRIAGVEDSQDPVIHEGDLYRGRESQGAIHAPPPLAVHQDVIAPVDPVHNDFPSNQANNDFDPNVPADDTLREEIYYQEEMRRRLRKQQEEIAQLSSVVPPLNLSRTSTPREEGARDSLDISLRSESEEDEEAPDYAGLAVAHPTTQPLTGTNNSAHGQRLSAQHRAEMNQVLSSMGGNPSAGPEFVAIDKDLYESSRRSRHEAHEEVAPVGQPLPPPPPQQMADPEMEENLEFLRKIHDYNEALRAKVQEEVWNAHAASAATSASAAKLPAKEKRLRKLPPSGQRMAGQSAPPDVGRTFLSQTSSQQRLRQQIPMEDFVRRNKSIPEQMQRVRSKSYSERYRERHSPSSSERRKPVSVPHRGQKRVNQNVPPPNLSAPPPISEEDEGESSIFTGGPIRAPLGPIQVSPGMTLDLNLHIHPHGAVIGETRQRAPYDPSITYQPASPHRIPPHVQYEAERQREWAFVHDPEHSFQPPSPRSQMLQKFGKTAQPRLNYNEDLLDHQANMAAGFSKQSPLPPIPRHPESLHDNGRRQNAKTQPFVLRNKGVQEPVNQGSYLDVFKQTQSGVVAHAQYRQYTLREYKNLRNIAQMGGLGPDFENDGYKSQRDRNVRRKKYAEEVNSRNIDEITKATKKVPPPPEQRMREKFTAMDQSKPTKRQLMLEYMKGLEKRHIQLAEETKRREELETVRPTQEKLQKKFFDSSDLDDRKSLSKKTTQEILNDTEFEKLKRRHEQDRVAQESIRQQAVSSRSQATTSNR